MAQKPELHEHDLDPRAREVLREIILQHIDSGEPIGSRTLAKCGKFQLSPASLRNVMADLEDHGLLQQPHTSAGRIPTDRGYRFFINHSADRQFVAGHGVELLTGAAADGFELPPGAVRVLKTPHHKQEREI